MYRILGNPRIAEVAEALGISYGMVKEAIERNEIPAIRFGSGRRIIQGESLERRLNTELVERDPLSDTWLKFIGVIPSWANTGSTSYIGPDACEQRKTEIARGIKRELLRCGAAKRDAAREAATA